MIQTTDVFVGGSAMTEFGELYDRGVLDLLVEVAQKTLADANQNYDQVEAVYLGNMLGGATENLQHLGSQFTGLMGGHKPVYFFEAACGSGGMALHSAWKDIRSGQYQNVLVLGAEKMTEHAPDQINQWLMRATNRTEQMSGITFAGLYALIADYYLRQYNLSADDLAYVPALMHRHSAQNPLAQFQMPVSLEQIRSARMVASPFRLFDCSPVTDGAAGVFLQARPTDIKVSHSGMGTDCPDLGGRKNLTSFASTQFALGQMNLPQNWRDNLSVLEVHDCFSISLVIALEDLGLAEPGTGLSLVKSLYENPEKHNYQLNPSGGLKACGHPVGATGIKQIHSVISALKNSKTGATGFTHNLGGTGGTALLHLLQKC